MKVCYNLFDVSSPKATGPRSCSNRKKKPRLHFKIMPKRILRIKKEESSAENKKKTKSYGSLNLKGGECCDDARCPLARNRLDQAIKNSSCWSELYFQVRSEVGRYRLVSLFGILIVREEIVGSFRWIVTLRH